MKFFVHKILDLWVLFLGKWPRLWVRALGFPLGVLWFDILRIRRKVVLENLRIAFPEKSDDELVKIGRKSVYQLTENFFEFFLIPSMNPKWLRENVIFEGEESLKNALAQGRGVYILSMHLGHGDMGVSSLAVRGYKIHLISKFFKNQFFNDLWYYIRRAQGVSFIEPHGSKTPFEILKAIKNNESVVFVNDQYMGKPFGIETEFFKKKTGTAFGLAIFYLKTRSPVIPIYIFNGKDGKIHLKIEPALVLEPLIVPDKEKTYQQITQKVTNEIERIVRQHPEQWMWVHRRWKDFG